MCCSCSQTLHAGCLRTALIIDSRCPLCRADLAIVGYTSNGAIRHPDPRRCYGSVTSLEHFRYNLAVGNSVLTRLNDVLQQSTQWLSHPRVFRHLRSMRVDIERLVTVLDAGELRIPVEATGEFYRYRVRAQVSLHVLQTDIERLGMLTSGGRHHQSTISQARAATRSRSGAVPTARPSVRRRPACAEAHAAPPQRRTAVAKAAATRREQQQRRR